MKSYNSAIPSSAGRSRGQPARVGSVSNGDSSIVESSRARIHSLQSEQAALQQHHQQQWDAYTQNHAYQQQPPQLLHAQQAWRASPSPAAVPSTQYNYSKSPSTNFQPQQQQPQFQPRPPSSSNQLAMNKKPSTSSGASQPVPRAVVSRPTRSASASHSSAAASVASVIAPSVPPSTAAILSASMRSRTDDVDSTVRSAETPTPSQSIPSPFSPSSTSHIHASGSGSSNNPHSLKEKVALALADLENIKSKNYRPNTAAPGTARESALPRPQVSSHKAASASLHISAAADSRAAEELRTAKSILRKLYKKNVQLSQDIKRLRERKDALGSSGANHSQQNPPLNVNDSLNLDEHEQTLLHARNPDSENDDDEDGEEQELADADGNDDGDNDNPDEDDMISPRKSRRSHNRSKSKKVEKGGSSHLLFLLGERDTTINRLQGQVQALTRRLNVTNAKLEIATGNTSSFKDGSASTAASSAGAEEKEGAFNEAEMEGYKKQMERFRQSLSQQLRSQLIQLNLSSQELPPNGRAAAYIRDLEQCLLWEASWRHVEKVALNAQLLRSEKQSQDSWVSTRLKEKEVADLQNNMHALDTKVRMIDTQLAATLEQKKGLEQENLRLKKALENANQK